MKFSKNIFVGCSDIKISNKCISSNEVKHNYHFSVTESIVIITKLISIKIRIREL